MEHLPKIMQIFFHSRDKKQKGYKMSVNLVFVFYKELYLDSWPSVSSTHVATQPCKAQKAPERGLFL